MALKITQYNNQVIFENTETGDEYPYNSIMVEGKYGEDSLL